MSSQGAALFVAVAWDENGPCEGGETESRPLRRDSTWLCSEDANVDELMLPNARCMERRSTEGCPLIVMQMHMHVRCTHATNTSDAGIAMQTKSLQATGKIPASTMPHTGQGQASTYRTSHLEDSGTQQREQTISLVYFIRRPQQAHQASSILYH
jgi:hypothetical protein